MRDSIAQRRQSVVFLLIAQLLQEAHAQMLAIQVAAGVIKKMDLEERDGNGIHRRPPADARDARPEALHVDDENPGDRRWAAQDDVRSRESERATELGAMRDAPTDHVRVAK